MFSKCEHQTSDQLFPRGLPAQNYFLDEISKYNLKKHPVPSNETYTRKVT